MTIKKTKDFDKSQMTSYILVAIIDFETSFSLALQSLDV